MKTPLLFSNLKSPPPFSNLKTHLPFSNLKTRLLRKWIPALLCTCVLLACQKVISPNLPSGASALVVEGDVSNTPPPYLVTLSQSVNFDSSNSFPGISGATIRLKDSTLNITDTLKEIAQGYYETVHFPTGVPGHTYTLQILLQGKGYYSYSTMPAPVHLDSIGFVTSDLFQDPAGTPNYYHFVEYNNGVHVSRVLVFDDRLSNGKYISEPLANDTSDHILPGDTLQVNLECIDSAVYNYLYELSLITTVSTQSVAPANPQSNISGGCQGYFSAHTVSSKTVIVP
jgi:hypothetical protein